MNNINNINIETLTPVHIGSGRSLNPNFEYIFHRKNAPKILSVIDDSKVLDVIGEEYLGQWLSIIDKEENLIDLLEMRKPNLIPEDIAHRIIEVVKLGPSETSPLKEQLHAGVWQKPMIPGSSLKGSIRTAILRKLILDDPHFAQQIDKYMQRRGNKVRFKDQQIIANYFGKKDRTNFRNEIQLDANRDFMRLIRVADAYFPNLTECHKLEIINESQRGWSIKEEESTYVECIPKGIITNSSIQIPQQLLELMLKGKFPKTEMTKKRKDLFSISMLFPIINNCTLALLDQEISFWETENNPKAIGDYLEILLELETEIKATGKEKSDTCIMRVGAGSGWDFMTGSWPSITKPEMLTSDAWHKLKVAVQKKDYRGNMSFPKTRKLIVGGMPLGFVKIKAL